MWGGSSLSRQRYSILRHWSGKARTLSTLARHSSPSVARVRDPHDLMSLTASYVEPVSRCCSTTPGSCAMLGVRPNFPSVEWWSQRPIHGASRNCAIADSPPRTPQWPAIDNPIRYRPFVAPTSEQAEWLFQGMQSIGRRRAHRECSSIQRHISSLSRPGTPPRRCRRR